MSEVRFYDYGTEERNDALKVLAGYFGTVQKEKPATLWTLGTEGESIASPNPGFTLIATDENHERFLRAANEVREKLEGSEYVWKLEIKRMAGLAAENGFDNPMDFLDPRTRAILDKFKEQEAEQKAKGARYDLIAASWGFTNNRLFAIKISLLLARIAALEEKERNA